MLQIYQSSFFESESQQYFNCFIHKTYCCKYIKVPFLKANHNTHHRFYAHTPIVANISKFLFWKRITTGYKLISRALLLLQIYQSSFFESESQLALIISFAAAIVANISKFLFWKRITTKLSCYFREIILLQIYQSSFFESESQRLTIGICLATNCCKYIKVPFLKANHNSITTLFILRLIVANISKFLFWKRITTLPFAIALLSLLLQIYQSSFFESESQLWILSPPPSKYCCKYIKVPFLKANHNCSSLL